MLPSQTARPSASRAHMYRRGKGRPWFVIAGGAVVIIAGIFLTKWIIGGGEPANADAGTSQAQPDGANASPPAVALGSADQKQAGATPSKQPAPANGGSKPNEPVKIAMGGTVPQTNKPVANDKPAPPTTPASSPPAKPAPPKNEPALPPPTAANGGTAGGAGGAPRQANPAAPAANQAPSTPPPSPAPAPQPSNTPVSQRVQIGLDLIKQNKPVEARKMLSEALAATGVAPAEAERIRIELAKINDRLVFSPEVAPNDTFATTYQVASGDSLAKIAKKLGLAVDWRFIQRINQISDPAKIRVGQRIKIIKGPFHVIIDKRTFRADLYLGDGSDRVYVRSLQVGLGEFGATPEGAFAVKPDSKLINPAWTNPRTGEYFQPEDPKNPLGEYWIGLVGASDNIRGLETYGIHGTIDPTSIGKEMSMGCVRLRDEDIKLLYEVLTEQGSRIEIHGSDWP